MTLNEVYRTAYRAVVRYKRATDKQPSLIHNNSCPGCKNVESPLPRGEESASYKEFWADHRYRAFSCSFCGGSWSTGAKDISPEVKDAYEFD